MKRTPLIRRTPLRATRKKPWRRKAEDRVPPSEANYVFARDGAQCLAPVLDPAEAGECFGRLTLEHVKTESMMGKRAPSDRRHMLVLCLGHNTDWALTHKALEREYLEQVELPESIW